MALDKTILSNSFYNAFLNMNNLAESDVGLSEGNTYAANQIALAIDAYLRGAQISSEIDVGTYAEFTYTGKSSGERIIIDISSLTTKLASHFMADDLSDDKIANYIADDINTTLAKATINVTSSGSYIIPGSPPVTEHGSGEGIGIFTGIPTILSNELKQTFREMFQHASNSDSDYDGNKDFANRLANCIHRYINQPGCLVLNYTGPLLYCTTIGIIS